MKPAKNGKHDFFMKKEKIMFFCLFWELFLSLFLSRFLISLRILIKWLERCKYVSTHAYAFLQESLPESNVE